MSYLSPWIAICLALLLVACHEGRAHFVAEAQCASGWRWGGAEGGWTPDKELSPEGHYRGAGEMFPGRNCIRCHQSGDDDAPRFVIAGTVYATDHEPNDCLGAPGATVVITDAKNRRYVLPVNGAGNFYLTKAAAPSFATPYRAAVRYQGRENAMPFEQTVGSCNYCHTAIGVEGAPGRILLPRGPSDGSSDVGANDGGATDRGVSDRRLSEGRATDSRAEGGSASDGSAGD